ncbi:MAG: 30S ribosomal protein S9 [Aeriscardovia sp.]|nr:30S ribosomal protein S9 [Aeriscardovia sp.]
MAENQLQDAVAYSSETETKAGAGQSLIAPGYGTGKRKNAVARVWLKPGSGKWTVNGRSLENYFTQALSRREVQSPFTLLHLEGKFDVFVRVEGGGISGQAGAVRLGISRALNEIDRDHNRETLKKHGFLTRDARVVERKKPGLHKARKAPQYSKR